MTYKVEFQSERLPNYGSSTRVKSLSSLKKTLYTINFASETCRICRLNAILLLNTGKTTPISVETNPITVVPIRPKRYSSNSRLLSRGKHTGYNHVLTFFEGWFLFERLWLRHRGVSSILCMFSLTINTYVATIDRVVLNHQQAIL